MSDAFDEAMLIDRVDDDFEFLEETVVMLEEDSPPLLEAIRAAAASGDAAAMCAAGHALKGMIGNFCAEPARAAAAVVEKMGRDDDLSGADAAVACVDRESTRLIQALRAFLQARAT